MCVCNLQYHASSAPNSRSASPAAASPAAAYEDDFDDEEEIGVLEQQLKQYDDELSRLLIMSGGIAEISCAAGLPVKMTISMKARSLK